jgi:hypothetical protein
MDEAKRFIRYVIPGLALPLQFLLMMCLIDNGIHRLERYVEIGTIALVFFTSGFTGYLFSNLFYGFFWKCCFPKIKIKFNHKMPRLNYRKLVYDNDDLFKDLLNDEVRMYSSDAENTKMNDLFNEKKIKSLKFDEGKKNWAWIVYNLTQKECWVLLNTIWRFRGEDKVKSSILLQALLIIS